MRYRYVTIEREYGSRGSKIAEKLAKSCQIPCYGREILELVAKEQNIDVEDIERYEESVTNSVLYTIFMLGRVQAGEVMHRFDKKRANYYYANTAKKWRDENNYELVLDSGKLGADGCEAAIKGVFNNIF